MKGFTCGKCGEEMSIKDFKDFLTDEEKVSHKCKWWKEICYSQFTLVSVIWLGCWILLGINDFYIRLFAYITTPFIDGLVKWILK